MQGGVGDVLLSVGTAILGVFGLSWGLTGYLFRPLAWPQRIVLLACGIAIMPSPVNGLTTLLFNIGAFVIGAAIIAYEWHASRRSETGVPVVAQSAEPS